MKTGFYERKVSHLNKSVLPARRMVLHLRKESNSYSEGGFFIPIRKVNHSSKLNPFETER